MAEENPKQGVEQPAKQAFKQAVKKQGIKTTFLLDSGI